MMMAWEDEQNQAAAPEPHDMPLERMSAKDRLTYDPTQGPGTTVWQETVRRQRELNAQTKGP